MKRFVISLQVDRGAHKLEQIIRDTLCRSLSKKKHDLGEVQVWSVREVKENEILGHTLNLVYSLEQKIEDAAEAVRCHCDECQDNSYH